MSRSTRKLHSQRMLLASALRVRGRTHTEIAQILGIDIRTVYRLLSTFSDRILQRGISN